MDHGNHNPQRGMTKTVPQQVTWQAPEFAEHKKHPLWFAGFTVVVAAVVLYGIYTKSWTMVIAFVLFGLIGLVFASQKPKQIQITLSGKGVQIGEMLVPFSMIRKYWIIYHPGQIKALYIQTHTHWNHTHKIELADQDPVTVKHFLQEYIEEDLDAQESLGEVIARKIKF